MNARMTRSSAGNVLPDHVAESVSQLADLHAAHQETAGQAELTIRAVTRTAGRPMFLVLFLSAIGLWLIGNTLSGGVRTTLDDPPFVYLELTCTIIGVCLTILILVTQQRDDALAQRREQLTLELAVISDRKSAKIISLLEELRRDSPDVTNRADHEAIQMAMPDDPRRSSRPFGTVRANPTVGSTSPTSTNSFSHCSVVNYRRSETTARYNRAKVRLADLQKTII